MAGTSIKVGPPFLGMGPDAFATDGTCQYCENFVPKGGRLERRPCFGTVVSYASNLGCHATGWKDRSVTVALSQDANGVTARVNRFDLSYVEDLTAMCGETPKCSYSFAELGGHLYFAAGHNVFDLDLESLALGVLVMTAGVESGTKTYLKRAPSARHLMVHNGRLWFFGLEEADIPVYGIATDDSRFTDDTSWIVSGSLVRFTPRHILRSDPYNAGQVQSLKNIVVEDGDAPAVGGCSYQGGVVVLTTKSAWFLSGSPDPTRLDRLGSGGCVSAGTISGDQRNVYWLGYDGLYYLEGTTVGRISTVDWLWNGQVPEVVRKNIGDVRFLLQSDRADYMTAKIDVKNGLYITAPVLQSGYPGDFASDLPDGMQYFLVVLTASKTVVFFKSACQEETQQRFTVGTATASDVGSESSDLLFGEYAQISALFSEKLYDDSTYTAANSTGVKGGTWVSALKESTPAYIRVHNIDVVAAPNDYGVKSVSAEQENDFITSAGDEAGINVGSLSNDEVDENTFPRWLDEDATTGPEWLADTDTEGPAYCPESSGMNRADVVGHGRAVAIEIFMDNVMLTSNPVGGSADRTRPTQNVAIEAAYLTVSSEGER